MINETVNLTLQKMTFEDVTNITTTTPMIIAQIVVWFLPIIVYLIVGSVARARSADGRKLSSRMISSPNYLYAFLIWFFLQAGLFLVFITYPVWLKVLG